MLNAKEHQNAPKRGSLENDLSCVNVSYDFDFQFFLSTPSLLS